MAAHKFQTGKASGTRSRNAYARNGISFAPVWQAAVTEAIADVMCADVVAPDLLVTFISTAWSDTYQPILERIRTETGCRTLIGCSSSGVIAGESCHESAPGISIMAMWLPDAILTPTYIDGIPAEWPWGSDVDPANVHGIMLFSDPFRTDAQRSLESMRQTCPNVPIIGALASTVRSDRRAWVYLDGEVYEQGAVAITIEGPYDLVVRVSQGGTPIGYPWTITEVDHNQIISISNRRAIDVMNETLDMTADYGVLPGTLLVGFPMSEYQDTFTRQDFVARGIIDKDPVTGKIKVGGIPRPGQTIQFLSRNPIEAGEDLDSHLNALKQIKRPVVGALLSTCKGRGSNMFGCNDHDARAVANVLPDVPMIGLYSLGELGPVKGVPAYNAFAVALGLIVER